MGHKFAEIAFTESVQAVQEQQGSLAAYSRLHGGDDFNHLLGDDEVNFIAERDSFYMASVSETGWPYVQHRGGPVGFVRVLNEATIGFADFRGNRQYVSLGNIQTENRVSIFFMDYANRRRLKMLGRVQVLGADETNQLTQLEVADYKARVERGFLIHIEAFDWNCPQHITPRYSEAEVEALMAPLREENRRLQGKRR